MQLHFSSCLVGWWRRRRREWGGLVDRPFFIPLRNRKRRQLHNSLSRLWDLWRSPTPTSPSANRQRDALVHQSEWFCQWHSTVMWEGVCVLTNGTGERANVVVAIVFGSANTRRRRHRLQSSPIISREGVSNDCTRIAAAVIFSEICQSRALKSWVSLHSRTNSH